MKRKQPKSFKNLGLVTLVVISVFCLVSFSNKAISIVKMINSTQEIKAEKYELLATQNKLENEVKKLEDDEYVKSYARGNYLMTGPNEKVFVLPSGE